MRHKHKVGDVFTTNTCGSLELIEDLGGNKYKVKFHTTGYEVIASMANIAAGKVLDPVFKKNRVNSWKPVELYYENNAGYKLVAFAKMRNKYKVRFLDTGYETVAYIGNVKEGKITDPYAISVLGVGWVGEFPRVPYWKQAKQLWSNVMKRCYNPKDYMGYYGRAFVDERWLCFANFLEDLPHLENFDKWLEGKTNGEPYNFDKDLKIPGNNVYSREACMFVTEYENKSAGAINARALDKINGRYS